MFEPSDHHYSTPYQGDPAEAMAIARSALLGMGFEVVVDSGSQLHVEGPGLRSTNQPPLLGVTELRLQANRSSIDATAVLGGVANMKTFIYLFPPGLFLSLFAFNNIATSSFSWLHLLWVTPWIFIAPLFGKALERRTTEAVEKLVRGMARTPGPVHGMHG